MMQPPPPAGCTGPAPPPAALPPGDGGAGATPDDALIALARGLSRSPTPATAKASTATPPHIVATVPPLWFNTSSKCRCWTRDAQTRHGSSSGAAVSAPRGDRAGLRVVGIGSDVAGFHLLQDR